MPIVTRFPLGNLSEEQRPTTVINGFDGTTRQETEHVV